MQVINAFFDPLTLFREWTQKNRLNERIISSTQLIGFGKIIRGILLGKSGTCIQNILRPFYVYRLSSVMVKSSNSRKGRTWFDPLPSHNKVSKMVGANFRIKFTSYTNSLPCKPTTNWVLIPNLRYNCTNIFCIKALIVLPARG